MNFIAWTPIFIAVVIFTIWCLWHIATHDVPFMPKWGWSILVIVAMPLGGLVYVLVAVLDAGEYRADAEGRKHPDA